MGKKNPFKMTISPQFKSGKKQKDGITFFFFPSEHQEKFTAAIEAALGDLPPVQVGIIITPSSILIHFKFDPNPNCQDNIVTMKLKGPEITTDLKFLTKKIRGFLDDSKGEISALGFKD